MKKYVFVILTLILFVPLGLVFGQEDSPYQISMRRDWGYGMGNDRQGRMTLSVVGDETKIKRVTYLIDGAEMSVQDAAPFKFSFDTDRYPAGVHQLNARIEAQDGKSFLTTEQTYRFLTGSEVGAGMTKILIPIGIVAVLSMALPIAGQMIGKKKAPAKLGEAVNYGVSGGAICPKCGHPFARSLFSMHVGALKFERCPSCKKWSWVGRASAEQLKAAERQEVEQFSGGSAIEQPGSSKKSETEAIDDTRYMNGV